MSFLSNLTLEEKRKKEQKLAKKKEKEKIKRKTKKKIISRFFLVALKRVIPHWRLGGKG